MRRTAAEAAATRARIVDAALLAFATDGWEGATFDGVARQVGLTRGAVHHHFGSKADLLGAVLRDHWAVHGQAVVAPLRDPDRTPRERVGGFVAGYLTRLGADRGFRALATVNTLVAAHVGDDEDRLAEHRTGLDDVRDELRAVLAAPGTLRPGVDTQAAVFTVVALFQGAVTTAALEPDRLPATDAATAAVTTVLLDGMFAPPVPPEDR